MEEAEKAERAERAGVLSELVSVLAELDTSEVRHFVCLVTDSLKGAGKHRNLRSSMSRAVFSAYGECGGGGPAEAFQAL